MRHWWIKTVGRAVNWSEAAHSIANEILCAIRSTEHSKPRCFVQSTPQEERNCQKVHFSQCFAVEHLFFTAIVQKCIVLHYTYFAF